MSKIKCMDTIEIHLKILEVQQWKAKAKNRSAWKTIEEASQELGSDGINFIKYHEAKLKKLEGIITASSSFIVILSKSSSLKLNRMKFKFIFVVQSC